MQTIKLSVPAEAEYARAVRMMASSLAVVCDMSVEDVEDIRMAAEEAFVVSCATRPQSCDIDFGLDEGSRALSMDISLGDHDPAESDDADAVQALDLAELLLEAVCDECDYTEDGTALHILKRSAAQHADE